MVGSSTEDFQTFFRRVENAVFVSFLNFEFKFRFLFENLDDPRLFLQNSKREMTMPRGSVDSTVRCAVCGVLTTEIEVEHMHGLHF